MALRESTLATKTLLGKSYENRDECGMFAELRNLHCRQESGRLSGHVEELIKIFEVC